MLYIPYCRIKMTYSHTNLVQTPISTNIPWCLFYIKSLHLIPQCSHVNFSQRDVMCLSVSLCVIRLYHKLRGIHSKLGKSPWLTLMTMSRKYQLNYSPSSDHEQTHSPQDPSQTGKGSLGSQEEAFQRYEVAERASAWWKSGMPCHELKRKVFWDGRNNIEPPIWSMTSWPQA